MTAKDANYWRDKYRELLVERDNTRKADTGEYQRAIALLAEAAGFLEGELATALGAVHQQARRGEWGRPGQLALLEDQLAQFKARLKQQREREKLAVDALVQALDIPHLANGRALGKQFHKGFGRQKFASEWAALLEGLAALQPAGEAPAQTGLLRRLFGSGEPAEGSTATSAAQDADQDSAHDELQEAAPAQSRERTEAAAGDPLIAEPAPAPELPQTAPVGEDRAHAERKSLSGHWIGADEVTRREPPFSKISDRISTVLGDFLRQIEPPWPAVAEKASAARVRIESGLNWYELVPTLEDIRDLVMALIVNAKSDYQAYLLTLLDNLNQLIELTGEAVVDLERDEAEFLQNLEQNVGSLSAALQTMNDVNELKSLVQSRVSSLADILSARKRAPAAEKLQALNERVQALQHEAEARQQELEQHRAAARTDALTGLPNRAHYNERAHQEVERAKRYGRPLSMAVCDVDHFKAFNDNYSHLAGDRVLKVIGQAIAKKLRDSDFIARFGGEEFVVLMPETSGADCMLKMDRIREAVAATAFKFKEQNLKITFSAGIAEWRPSQNASELFERADKMLYVAKDAGRNCCRLAPEQPD